MANLPQDYKELQWIESTGEQYIRTNLSTGTINSMVYGGRACLTGTKNELQTFIGNDAFGFVIKANSTLIDIGDTADYGLNVWHSFEIKNEPSGNIYNRSSYLDGNQIYSWTSSYWYNAPIILFADYFSSSATRRSKIRVSSFYIKDLSDNYLGNFIPVKRISDGVVGMYDTVSDDFYTNSGSGEFRYPLDFNDFQQVEYIESTGTQYIDTEISIHSYSKKLKQVVDISVDNTQGSYPTQGVGNYGGSYGYYWQIPSIGNQFGLTFGDDRNSQEKSTFTRDTNRHIFTIDAYNGIMSCDDTIYNDKVAMEVTSGFGSGNIYLFALNNNGPRGYSNITLYGCQMYDMSLNEKIRDFIPVYRKSDNKPGLYDLENNVFYTNAGSGEFNIGPNVYNLTCTYTTTDDSTPVTVGYDTYADLKTNLTQNSTYKEKLLSVILSGKGQDTDASDLFNGCQEITSLDITELDTSNVTNFQSAFYAVTKLRSLDLSNLDTSSCTNMGAMFALTNFTKDLSNFDTSNVTTMQGMFGMAIGNLIFGPGWDTSNVTTFRRMFYLSDMTGNVYDIDFTTWDTSSCVDMERMFATSNMARMDLSTWDISNVTDISRIFASLDVVTEIHLPKTLPASGAIVDGMFDYSALTSPTSPITTIYCNDDWSTIVTASTSVFKKCTSLVGAIPYDAEKISSDYMNPTTGYFTPYPTSIPFKFNGNEVNEIYFNNNKLNHLYFNTNMVF